VVSQYHVVVTGRTLLLALVTESDRSYTLVMLADEPIKVSPEASSKDENRGQ
jgi:hypothetical protein